MQTTMHRIIGSDEALKGDTFGGIVVAAVMAGPEERKQLTAMGIKDSKKISDIIVHRLAQTIKQKFQWSIRNIYPEEYNKLYTAKRDGTSSEVTMTSLLNKLHKECADELRKKYSAGTERIIHVVDEFPGCKVGDIMVTKAEEKYIEVAAASVIARDAALKQLQELSKVAGFPIPKGSTHVQEALERVKKSTIPLHRLVKLNFRNVQAVLTDKKS